jgi:hypothetical protein
LAVVGLPAKRTAAALSCPASDVRAGSPVEVVTLLGCQDSASATDTKKFVSGALGSRGRDVSTDVTASRAAVGSAAVTGAEDVGASATPAPSIAARAPTRPIDE